MWVPNALIKRHEDQIKRIRGKRKKRRKRLEQLERIAATEITVSFVGEGTMDPILGPLTLETLYLVAKFGWNGEYSEDFPKGHQLNLFVKVRV